MKQSGAIARGIGLLSLTALCAPAVGDDDSSQVAILHTHSITPLSDALFQAESHPPATPAEWARTSASATDLVRAAQALRSIESAKNQQEWQQFTRALGEAAEQAAKAAQAKDQDALVSANGEIVSACEDCHTKYRDAGRSMKQ